VKRLPPSRQDGWQWAGLSPVLLAAAQLYAPAGFAQVCGFVDGESVAHLAAESQRSP